MGNFQLNYTGSQINAWGGRLDALEEQVGDLIDRIYPVGAIYISVNSTDPSILFGGTWEQIEGRFLLASNSTYTAGSVGGASTHTHNYGIKFGAYYNSLSIENNPQGYVLAYKQDGTFSAGTNIASGSYTANVNNAAATSNKSASITHRVLQGNTSYTSNYPPYLSVYMWKRTA